MRSCLFSLLCTSSTLSLEYGRKLKEFCFPLPATPLYFGIRKIIYFLGRSLNSHWTNRCLTLVSRITFHLSCGDCSCTLLSGREVVTDIWKSSVLAFSWWWATKYALTSVLADPYSVCARGRLHLYHSLTFHLSAFILRNCLLHSYYNNYKRWVTLQWDWISEGNFRTKDKCNPKAICRSVRGFFKL